MVATAVSEAWGFADSNQLFRALFWRLENSPPVPNSPIIRKPTQSSTWPVLFERLQQLDQLFQAWHEQLRTLFTWHEHEQQLEQDAGRLRGKSMDETASELEDGCSSDEGPGEHSTLRRRRSAKPRPRSQTLSDCHLEANCSRKQLVPIAVKPNAKIHVGDVVVRPPAMQICIMIVGTRGDVQPFLAIAKRLQQDGHRVRLATHSLYHEFVTSHGVEFYPLGGDPKELAAYMVKTGGRLIPPLKLETLQKDVPRQMQMLEEILQSTWPAVSAPDPDGEATGVPGPLFRAQAIISNPVTYGHIHVAEKLGVPLHIMFPQPWVPTVAFPHPMSNLPYQDKPQRRNYLSYKLVDLLMWEGTERIVNSFRSDVLGLPRIRKGGRGREMLLDLDIPHSFMWSPSLVPKPFDWGELYDVVGTVTLKGDGSSYTPSPELEAFLGNDGGPIFVGFGSMVLEDPRATTVMIIEAAKQANVRVLIQSSWTDMAGDLDIPDNVFFIGNCPHDWLLPRCSAVVHHGGAGTTAGGLLAGKPTFIVPFFGDQPFWGRAVVKAGVGVDPCPIHELTTEKLRAAFEELQSPFLRNRAQRLQKRMQSEDGAEEAVKSFYRHLPLRSMRCDLDHEGMATKWSRRDGVKFCERCSAARRSCPGSDCKDEVEYRSVDYAARGQELANITRFTCGPSPPGAAVILQEVGWAIACLNHIGGVVRDISQFLLLSCFTSWDVVPVR
ncbi:Sterol 3-beta-glucosyltransferase [Phytophthora fragariae]|uniref:Sterol 3-beta-glucosyltransferase n=1 Tax=Phytophthora fragariae TaxID=53985 RepID=A0A6A3L3M8_9STRA|nr:Sterol 3-beta-glucosyltransferase [Phytophthora fragariae]KAE9112991.1 Sterol 3-beta-glucosyltransferase [Phytophthora fragariae]